MNTYKYGDIVTVRVNNHSETNQKGGTRNAVIVSADVINDILQTVIVCPIIASKGVSDTRIGATFIPKNVGGLERDGLAFSLQIKTIHKDRIVQRIGSLPMEYLYQIKESLQAVLDLDE
ncbi:MAG: type II toxin-antitoxin system PemK/MazF family toxin [bacterium]